MRFALSTFLLLLPLTFAVPFPLLEARDTSNTSAGSTVQGFDANTYAKLMTAITVQSMVQTIDAGLAQADPGDPNTLLLKEILNQTFLNTVVRDQLGIQCNIPVVPINNGDNNLNPTTNRTLSFAAHYGASLSMGSTGLLQNSSLVFDQATTELLQQAAITGVDTAAAAITGVFPGVDGITYPSLLTQAEYTATIVSKFINCSDSSGNNLALPQQGQMKGLTFNKAFDEAENGTITYGNSTCPPDVAQCFCQSMTVTNNSVVSTDITEFPHCKVPNDAGISLWFITTDATALTSNVTERALQTNILGVSQMTIVPENLVV